MGCNDYYACIKIVSRFENNPKINNPYEVANYIAAKTVAERILWDITGAREGTTKHSHLSLIN